MQEISAAAAGLIGAWLFLFWKERYAMYDVLIIGGGVIGCAIARELSRYRLKLCLV